ncbi:histidine kinase dimerization/phosphoacceptor domain -containing protein [Altererythrobacter sp. H2]|uniref:sensor histidine kinase n=1 Tax=Altererythrobacter sp. H2 TaxID=3108391 RepID=UPI002B4BD6E6|nr:histidine kinase dimerization/phosphoacceptor domain -containing protein [Altererythrobacter sp. H2]WRK95640.1 histidine kinase dimerization/phosphoacceptor domain -containing protein [Altererythrobacter sp. H2]
MKQSGVAGVGLGSQFDSAELGLIVEDAASEIYLFSAEDCRFLLVNRGARENLGYSMVELEAMTPWDIKPEVSEAQFRDMIRPLHDGTAQVLDFETIHRRKDGTDYRVEVRLQLVTNGSGKVFFAAIRDVTARHEMAEALRRNAELLEDALRVKDMLLHEVNHRVKNSLQTVISLLQMQAGQADDERLAADLGEAQSRVEVIAKIHHNLYATSQHNRIDFSAYLTGLANDIVMSHEGERTVTLSTDVEPGIDLTLDRAVPLALVVSEILVNAMKYAFVGRHGGRIGIAVRKSNDSIVLEIADDGVGFPGELGKTERTGIGSRIIRGLTARLDGTVAVASAGPGAIFRITVPA